MSPTLLLSYLNRYEPYYACVSSQVGSLSTDTSPERQNGDETEKEGSDTSQAASEAMGTTGAGENRVTRDVQGHGEPQGAHIDLSTTMTSTNSLGSLGFSEPIDVILTPPQVAQSTETETGHTRTQQEKLEVPTAKLSEAMKLPLPQVAIGPSQRERARERSSSTHTRPAPPSPPPLLPSRAQIPRDRDTSIAQRRQDLLAQAQADDSMALEQGHPLVQPPYQAEVSSHEERRQRNQQAREQRKERKQMLKVRVVDQVKDKIDMITEVLAEANQIQSKLTQAARSTPPTSSGSPIPRSSTTIASLSSALLQPQTGHGGDEPQTQQSPESHLQPDPEPQEQEQVVEQSAEAREPVDSPQEPREDPSALLSSAEGSFDISLLNVSESLPAVTHDLNTLSTSLPTPSSASFTASSEFVHVSSDPMRDLGAAEHVTEAAVSVAARAVGEGSEPDGSFKQQRSVRPSSAEQPQGSIIQPEPHAPAPSPLTAPLRVRVLRSPQGSEEEESVSASVVAAGHEQTRERECDSVQLQNARDQLRHHMVMRDSGTEENEHVSPALDK